MTTPTPFETDLTALIKSLIAVVKVMVALFRELLTTPAKKSP